MFRFRLEPLLHIRRIEEDKAKVRYAEKLSEYKLEQEALALLHQELDRCYLERTQTVNFAFNEERISFLKAAVIAQDKRVEYRRQHAQFALDDLLLKKRQAEVVERLRERHLKRFQNEVRKRENKKLDEVYITRYQRKGA